MWRMCGRGRGGCGCGRGRGRGCGCVEVDVEDVVVDVDVDVEDVETSTSMVLANISGISYAGCKSTLFIYFFSSCSSKNKNVKRGKNIRKQTKN